jgi:hypothetical protein
MLASDVPESIALGPTAPPQPPGDATVIRRLPMSNMDPYVYLQQVAGRLPHMTDRREIETALDEVEYLFDAVTPEMQDQVEQLIQQLRAKLAATPE